jgi:hypothetical protein
VEVRASVDVAFPQQLAKAHVAHRRPRREAPLRGERDGFDILSAAGDDDHALAREI